VTLSVTDVERSTAFYARLLGGTLSCGAIATDKGATVDNATLALPDGFLGLSKLGAPRVHHFCVGVEHFAIDTAFEQLQRDFPASKPTIYRGEELYFRDPDGILGQVSGLEYRGQRKTP
jgi:catechol 2,3-dioxygenase-like lactoylglutathione lyase family enzyme